MIGVSPEIAVAAEIERRRRALGRTCDGCTACCRVLRVAEIAKPAGELCRHARPGSGCAIYALRPTPCRTFAYRWLCDGDFGDEGRPASCGMVLSIQHALQRSIASPRRRRFTAVVRVGPRRMIVTPPRDFSGSG